MAHGEHLLEDGGIDESLPVDGELNIEREVLGAHALHEPTRSLEGLTRGVS